MQSCMACCSCGPSSAVAAVHFSRWAWQVRARPPPSRTPAHTGCSICSWVLADGPLSASASSSYPRCGTREPAGKHSASCLYSLEPLSNRFVCRYLVHSLLGCGTFGQVALCTCLETHAEVAVKVIKNQRAYFNQAVIEAQILKLLNQSCDPTGDRHIVRMLDYFLHASHLCIVFERLHANLYDVLRLNGYKGLSLNLVCIIVRQVRSHPRSFFAAISCFLSCHHRARVTLPPC
jgi:serine/threonine protein kinase